MGRTEARKTILSDHNRNEEYLRRIREAAGEEMSLSNSVIMHLSDAFETYVDKKFHFKLGDSREIEDYAEEYYEKFINAFLYNLRHLGNTKKQVKKQLKEKGL